MDFVLNGEAHGSVAATLLKNNFEPGAFRPWVGDDGCSYVTLRNGSEVAKNAEGKSYIRPKYKNVRLAMNVATLRKDEWIELDKALVASARPRLKLVSDVRGRGLVYTIPNGLAKTSLETETMSDPGEAIVSMDGTRESKGDRPQFDLKSLPLPIIHSDFGFSARQIAVSRNSGAGLDTTMVEAAGRRIAEIQEQMHLGVGTPASFAFAGGTIQGLTNFSSRNTGSVTDPTATAWTPQTLLNEILTGKEGLRADRHFGPYMVYVGTGWEQYLDRDWSASKGDITLRARLLQIDGISGIQSLDYLTDTHEFDIIIVQMTSDVIRTVVGMEIMTVQWETQGGMKQNFKAMCIIVPQLRAEYNGRCGIMHLSTP